MESKLPQSNNKSRLQYRSQKIKGGVMSIRALIALYKLGHPGIVSWIDGQNIYVGYGEYTLFKTSKDIYLIKNNEIIQKITPLIMPKI